MTRPSFPALAGRNRLPNLFDLAALLCVFGLLIAVATAAGKTFGPLSAPDAVDIHLDPAYLPGYALRTTLRMFAALLASLVFTFTYATLAAKSRRAAMLLIPLLDILQSVPILGFLSFTVVFFMSLFPGRVLGAELAAIFAIFTSQAWNMAFSFYQSLSTVPPDLTEAARGFKLTAWQRFWKLEVPFAIPGLVWNTMLSMSGGWFFVVASEAISVGDTTWKLPGIGSFVAVALEKQDIGAVLWAIATMLVVILIYDQVLFRPLVAWSAKFRVEQTAGQVAEDPWLLALLRRTRLLRVAGDWFGDMLRLLGNLRLLAASASVSDTPEQSRRATDYVWIGGLAILVGLALWKTIAFVATELSLADVGEALALAGLTLLRVTVLMALASAVWVPVGVWIGLRPKWARLAQPVAQFLAAFPANLLFPPFVVVIVAFKLNADIWLSPLMVLGTQWYILFNVIAGAASFPGDLQEAARNFRVRGWLWWRRVILPGILPYYITGAIAASGGSWNASIVSEVASWGDTRLVAHGLGAYIAQATEAGDSPRIVLGVVLMCVFVVAVNRIVWRPLHEFAMRRLTLT